MDAYLRPDPSDALSIEDKEAAPLEFVFTRPEWSHEGEYLVAAPPPAIAEPPPPPPKPKTTYGRYPSAGMFGGDEFGGIGLPNGTLTGVHGTAGTGNAGDAGVSQGGQHAEGADQLVRLLGGEAPLLSVLQKLDVPSLRNLKANGKRWRNRCRTALCSAAWAEIARGGHSLDLGITRHWLPEGAVLRVQISLRRAVQPAQRAQGRRLCCAVAAAVKQGSTSTRTRCSRASRQPDVRGERCRRARHPRCGRPRRSIRVLRAACNVGPWLVGGAEGGRLLGAHIQRLAANAPCSRACCRAWHAPQPHVAYSQLEQKCTARSRPCRHAAAAAVARREREQQTARAEEEEAVAARRR